MGADPLKQRQVYERARRYMRRPSEQLYSTNVDPYELNNLSNDDSHAAVKAKLASALSDWMKSQADPGADVDTADALQAARRNKHLHGKK